jgi:hypothetical protein
VSSKDNRLNKIAGSLTAKERALLALHAWQEDREVDPHVRWSMPREQYDEFNHYANLMTGVNTHLTPWLIVVMEEIEKLGLRHAMLSVFMLWQNQAFEVADYIFSQTKEPVSESEYAVLKEQAREKMLALDAAAYVLTEHHDGWAPEDLTGERDEHNVAIVSPESWDRVKGEKAKEIAALVASGALKGSGKGRGLRVQAGPFYDWLGEDVPVLPDWALAYDVVPDDDPDLGVRKWRREEMRRLYRHGPTRLVVHMPDVEKLMEGFGPGPDDGKIKGLVASVKDSFREGVVDHTRHLRAIDRVVAEVWQEFGEDPLLPELRDMLDKGNEQLADLHEQAEKFCGPFELEEPTDEEVAFVHRLVTKESREEDSTGRITVSLA